jgi:hypothetical protein
MGKSFALYTTYYPEVVDYLPQWVESFHAQTDKNIDICIGVDGKDSSYISEMLGRQVSPQFILAKPGETPTSLRSRALEILSSEFDAVILSDMDDILLPTRIVTAKEQLSKCDLSCCAMQIMNIDKLIKALQRYNNYLSTSTVYKECLYLGVTCHHQCSICFGHLDII